MKKTLSLLFALPFLVFSSCQKDSDPCEGINASPYDIMQRIMLVELDEWGHHGNRWGISDMDSKDVELIAMTERFGEPLRDRDGKIVKQVAERTEVRPQWGYYSAPGKNNYMNLYMANREFHDSDGALHQMDDTYFILKIDDGLWFRIRAKYYRDNCRHINLKGFFFEGEREYVAGTEVKYIPIDEAKKREELKENYPYGFPYKL